MAVCSQFAHLPFDGLSQESVLLLLLWFWRFRLNSTVPFNLMAKWHCVSTSYKGQTSESYLWSSSQQLTPATGLETGQK